MNEQAMTLQSARVRNFKAIDVSIFGTIVVFVLWSRSS
jgi:hypothetical protein